MSREFLALVSLHHGHHNKTRADRFGVVESSSAWSAEQLAVDALLEHVLAGKAWVGCQLIGGKRNADNARESNLIVLDIDGDIQLEAFWANPFAARHCLLTYTSCSHDPDGEHRFRALFPCELHEGGDLHRAIYQQLVEALGFAPKDPSGEKPERLWYGNTNAEVRFGAGEQLSWDLVERAKDELAAELKRRHAPRPQATEQDQQLDNERAAYALQHLLRSSADGDFTSYWSPLLNAAAATGSDQVREAFFDWHARGHQSKSQKGVEKRFDKAGTKITPGQGAGQILSFAKQQHGSDWWRQLPKHLWFGGGSGSTTPPPISLASSRTINDILPPPIFGGPFPLSQDDTAAAVPSVVPSPAELQRLAKAAQPIVLASSKPHTGETSQATEVVLTLEDKLSKLYMLRAHGLLQEGDDLRQLAGHEIAVRDREILGEILRHPGYCNQPSEVERDLITHFRCEHQLLRNTTAPVKSFKLDGFGRKQVKWLIPNFLLAGRDHVLYAKGGVGKTTLALHMVRAISGDPEIGEFLDSGPFSNHHLWQRNPILFIGTDMFGSAEEVTNTSLQLFGMAGKEFLKQVDWWLEDEEEKTAPWELSLKDLTRLHDYLQGHHHAGTPVAAVFIDSMKAVCPDHLLVGQQGFKDYIKLTADLCARYGAALIWIHHARGDGAGAQGIQRITEASSANFHLKRDDKTKQITLEVEKIRGGAKARTLLLSSLFGKTAPRVMTNPDDLNGADNETSDKENLVLEVLQEHFKQHRIMNLGMSAEALERSYLGMKIGEIEKTLQSKYRYQIRGLSRRSLATILSSLKEAGRLTGKGSYRIPPHFQPELADQPDLTDFDDDSTAGDDLPGWT